MSDKPGHQVCVIEHAVAQHAELTGIAIGCGLAISVPTALLAWRFHWTRTAILGFAGLLYTIPSLALFVLIQPLTVAKFVLAPVMPSPTRGEGAAIGAAEEKIGRR